MIHFVPVIFLALYLAYAIGVFVTVRGHIRFIVLLPSVLFLFIPWLVIPWLGATFPISPRVVDSPALEAFFIVLGESLLVAICLWFWKRSPWPVRVLAAACILLVAYLYTLFLLDFFHLLASLHR